MTGAGWPGEGATGTDPNCGAATPGGKPGVVRSRGRLTEGCRPPGASGSGLGWPGEGVTGADPADGDASPDGEFAGETGPGRPGEGIPDADPECGAATPGGRPGSVPGPDGEPGRGP